MLLLKGVCWFGEQCGIDGKRENDLRTDWHGIALHYTVLYGRLRIHSLARSILRTPTGSDGSQVTIARK